MCVVIRVSSAPDDFAHETSNGIRESSEIRLCFFFFILLDGRRGRLTLLTLLYPAIWPLLPLRGFKMDLETENRIAAILMKEAAELRRQAEEEGIHAYLRQPNVRGRPNSRFLTATVLGVQQANRAVEVNEMWRVRQKEKDLDDRLKRRRDERSSDRSYREQHLDDGLKWRWGDESSSDRSYRDTEDLWRSTSKRHADGERKANDSCSSSMQESYINEEEGLRDDEIENFLNSRVKRGRGAVGSRMDETGPYLPLCPDSQGRQLAMSDMVTREEWGRHAVLGPEKPSGLVYHDSSEDESVGNKHKKAKKTSSSKHSKQHKSKQKSKDKKKRKQKEERRHRHRK